MVHTEGGKEEEGPLIIRWDLLSDSPHYLSLPFLLGLQSYNLD